MLSTFVCMLYVCTCVYNFVRCHTFDNIRTYNNIILVKTTLICAKYSIPTVDMFIRYVCIYACYMFASVYVIMCKAIRLTTYVHIIILVHLS